ncbi:MAG: hypothetical protein AB9872_03770 [Solidesulfovibrio sp.]
MIGRCRGRYFQALSGEHRIVFDAIPPSAQRSNPQAVFGVETLS